jgi:multicomponent Na+:H+ antiporter subunit B
MSTVIFRTVAPALTALMMIFSIFVLLRGHNEPGGGFIGGLIAASALAIYGIANGVDAVRRALWVHPNTIAGVGLLLSTLAGLLALPFGRALLAGIWWLPTLQGVKLPISTVTLFDIGVYLVVVGSITAIALTLEESD